MQSVKSIHTPRGLPWAHTSYLRMREDCLTASLPSIWKIPNTPLSLGSASLGSPLAQAGWPAAVLGLDGRGWDRESLLPLSNRLCRQRDSKLVQEKTIRCRTAAASHRQVHAVFLKGRGWAETAKIEKSLTIACFPERCKCKPVRATQKTYFRNNYNYGKNTFTVRSQTLVSGNLCVCYMYVLAST